MRQIKCEMCGSTDLIKTDGVFVCQSCGTKYSVEEARKMMIEGTVDVTVNKSDELSKYIDAARRAKSTKSFEDMERFYTLAKEIDPADWESTFYSVYAKAACAKLIQAQYYSTLLRNTLLSAIELFIDGEFDNKAEKAGQLIIDVIGMYKMLYTASFDHLKQFFNQIESRSSNEKPVSACKVDLGKCIDALGVMCLCTGTMKDNNERLIVRGYDAVQEMYVRVYDLYYAKYPSQMGEIRTVTNIAIESYENKIQSLNAGKGHVKPELKLPTASVQESGGCYIATAVYGSYDCPEVWTLRRYRDYELSKTWFGRAFIYSYYAISPKLVRLFGDKKWFRKMWKGKLDRMVKKLQDYGYESTPYNDVDW